MPVPLKCCCADVLLVHQQKEHNETSNSVNQIGFGLALCGALLYKLKWGLISGCSFSKASLVAGLWPVFSKAMRSWHNLFLISSTLHLCLHKPNKNSTKQNRILAEYLQIFYGGPRVLENPFCRTWTWKQSCKQGGSMSLSSLHTCTQSHFLVPMVIASPLFESGYMWSAHSLKNLQDWILKLTWCCLLYPLIGESRIQNVQNIDTRGLNSCFVFNLGLLLY